MRTCCGPDAAGLVILIYHRVGGRTRSQVDLATARFDEQVAELVDAGRVVSLDEGLRRLEAGDVADRPVVLTFDDGTTDWVDEALPCSSATGRRPPSTWPPTSSSAASPFPGDGPPISWSGLAELVASGLATIGSHTHTHALLDRADGAAAAAELDRSIDLLGERLGVECAHFAYPKALLGVAGRRGRGAAAVPLRHRGREPRQPAPGADLHRLTRTPIQVADGMRWFRRKAAGGMRLEDTARSLLNRGRYAGATT